MFVCFLSPSVYASQNSKWMKAATAVLGERQSTPCYINFGEEKDS